LELQEVTVRYGGIVALDSVSLGLGEGEIVALMGPNGAGKSTVLKAVFGLAPVVSGTISWRQAVLDVAAHQVVKLGVAFVPQGRRVFTQLTITENLEMGCLYLRDKEEKKRRLDETMELFPVLYEKRQEKASAMSGGEQQMLAIAKIVEINETRKTSIMVVEHNIRSILDVASRVYVLDKGKIAHDGTPSTVEDSDILTNVFLGTVE